MNFLLKNEPLNKKANQAQPFRTANSCKFALHVSARIFTLTGKYVGSQPTRSGGTVGSTLKKSY
jgi:hypothetical protein